MQHKCSIHASIIIRIRHVHVQPTSLITSSEKKIKIIAYHDPTHKLYILCWHLFQHVINKQQLRVMLKLTQKQYAYIPCL